MNQLNEKQKLALKYMTEGSNVFVTGQAGVGKSFLIKEYIKFANKKRKNTALTATTGVSALLIGGVTLYSYLGIGLGNKPLKNIYNKIMDNPFILKRWQDLETLLIDEISMLSPDVFDKLEGLARLIRNNNKVFGGIQIILMGDFLQLGVVGSDYLCFNAKRWSSVVQKTVYLKEIIRQENPEFQKLLTELRLGELSSQSKSLLEQRIGKTPNDPSIKPTIMSSVNRDVDRVNSREFQKLASENVFEYVMEIDFKSKRKISDKQKDFIGNNLKKYSRFKETLELCQGAQVMLLSNLDAHGGLVNGSRGVIERFENDLPVVRFLNGPTVTIDYMDTEHQIDDNISVILNQIPLTLSWAISIHKSQGMTIDSAVIDLSKLFAYSLAYVAISRVKNLENLYLKKGVDFDNFVSNPECLDFYNNLSD